MAKLSFVTSPVSLICFYYTRPKKKKRKTWNELGLRKFWQIFFHFMKFQIYGMNEKQEDFQKFIEDATGEKAQTFGEKFNSRIQTYRSKGLGAGYFWQSIENWEDQSR